MSKRLGAEFVLIADGDDAANRVPSGIPFNVMRSLGYLESIHDQALLHTTRDYVLRLDDDESASQAMESWLSGGNYTAKDHWKFPRMHLWGDESRFLFLNPLWPDHQTRLSRRNLAGGRNAIHCGSPYGGGDLAPVAILHHKFLVKSPEARREIVERYDRIASGAGTCFKAFQVPEEEYDSALTLPVNSGLVLGTMIDTSDLKEVALKGTLV